MGLNNCLQFIREKYPHLLKEDHLVRYAYQRIAVDISSYIYKYATIFGIESPQWMNSIIQFLIQFKINKVNPIIVFDGKPPVEKNDEISERKEKKKQTLDKISLLEKAYENYNQNIHTAEEYELLKQVVSKIELKSMPLKRLLVDIDIEDNSIKFNKNEIQGIQEYIKKQKQSVVYITQDHFKQIKDVLELLGIPYVHPDCEAENYCCFLVHQGVATGVMSCDTDCIAYSAKNIIFKFDPKNGNIVHLNTDECFEEWNLDSTSIIDFAILVGCDYNRKRKIAKIGPVNAIKLLNEYGKIENIPNLTFKQEEIDGIRNLFNPNYDPNILIKHTQPNLDKLKDYLTEHDLSMTSYTILDELYNKSTNFYLYNPEEDVSEHEEIETEENEENEVEEENYGRLLIEDN